MSPKEYNQCVDAHADGLYRFILKNMGDKDAAKDVVQDTFEKTWIKRENIQFEKAKSYLYTAAYRTMIDHIRKRKNLVKEHPSHTSDWSHNEQYSDAKEIIEEALETLPADQKAVITLRDYEGYSYEEIGEITGLSESQVKVYIYRGRLALKNYLVKFDLVL